MSLKRLVAALAVAVGLVWGFAAWTGRLDALAAGGASPAVKEFDPTKVTVVFLDVGQGDCIFIHTPNGRNVLIDAGEGAHPDNPYSRQFDAGTEVVVPFLRDHGITQLDAMVMSHPHSDHGGGFEAVLQMQDLKVLRFYDPGLRVSSGFYKKVLRLLRERHEEAEYHSVLEYVGDPAAEESEHASDYRLNRAMIGHNILEGDPSAELLILGPVRLQTRRCSVGNNNSIVNMLRAGKVQVLLTGDAEVGELGDMQRLYGKGLHATVLKVPHHGSKATSLNNAFITAVAPRYTVYQTGAENTYGHPHELTFARYKELLDPDPSILRNDFHGDIVLTIDGSSFRFETEKQADPAQVEVGRVSPRSGRSRSARAGG